MQLSRIDYLTNPLALCPILSEMSTKPWLALAIVGGLTTIPLALGVIGRKTARDTEIRPAA